MTSGSELDDWFVGSILPMEPALMRFLRRHWRSSDEHQDLRQDIYVKLYEAAAQGGAPHDPRAYLFTVARNLLIDKARRAQVVVIDIVADLEALDTPSDDFNPERTASARSELRRLQHALDDLPPRCREVVALRKIEGLSLREIALRMGIAEGTVEKQITLGMRSLAESLLAQGAAVGAAWVHRLRTRKYDG
ncbi:MAG: RNA polymerase sigma factor [Ideonella sp.]|nr:RNA polymerase sigma factor [Ideonella sp.]